MNTQAILECFTDGYFKRINCPQCENTFLTNVYEIQCNPARPTTDCAQCHHTFFHEHLTGWGQFVVLEKFAWGLEYFCDAIQQRGLTQVPFIRRIGILDDNNHMLDPSHIQLFNHAEPTYRMIYVMERLEHLDEADAAFFTEQIHSMDWQEEAVRMEIHATLRTRYGDPLADDIRQLCLYFREHEDYLAWDLHGENLMRRPHDGKIVVMDPYIPKTSDYMG